MKFKEYNLYNYDGKSNCVIRSLCKVYNKKYEDVYNELCSITKELNYQSFNDIKVFEEYMKRKNTLVIDYGKNIKIKDLKLNKGKYIVFCYDKKEFYHMIPIINDIIYDKDDKCLDLYTIKIYKSK